MVADNIAFLFPGQGAQYPGMGLDLAGISAEAKKVFDTASEVLGEDIAALIHDADMEMLKRTDVSQPSLAAASLAAAACLRERGIVPTACAGFSLGEYPALACAGVISLKDCFALTQARGKAMQAAVDRIAAGDGEAPGMAAVMGLAPERVEALIAEWKLPDLYAANINSPRQLVVSGSAAALAEAERRFVEAGARRVVRLPVAGPFHSPFMEEAAREFAPVLERAPFGDPAVPLFLNVSGQRVQSGAEAKALALRHMVEGVRWTSEEAAIAEIKPAAVLEAGPGKILRGLWKEFCPDIPCYGAGTAEEINALEELL